MKSIKMKLIIFVSSILLFFIVSSILLNSLLLEKYYVYKNKTQFLEYFEKSKKANTYEIDKMLLDLGTESGFEISIVNRAYEITHSSKLKNKDAIGKTLGKEQQNAIKKIGNEYFYGVLSKKDGDGKEIVFLSNFDDKDFILIKKPMKELSENASIANMFFVLIGGFLFIVSLPLVTLLSKHFAEPIKEIGEVVEKINNLDFSAKFKTKTGDEISSLGENINEISQKLDKTIGELKNTNKQLAEEMEMQKLFFASISHEFKTPLGLIRGYSEALNLNLGDKKEIVETITSEIDRLNLLINDITELIRFDRADFHLKISKFNIVSLINKRIGNFGTKLLEKEIKLEIHLPEYLEVNIDEERFLQLFDNLFSNAINYVDMNKIIKISLDVYETSFSLKIYNSSKSIDNKVMERLFDNFYRIDKDRSRVTGGSGLGLAIVKKIVQSHKGQCSIRNYEQGVLVEVNFVN